MIRLKLRCPKCKNSQLYQYDGRDISQKRKKCVYCPSSFGVQFNREAIVE